jgi:murein L,D-transpeptidase YcbB/YkuD
MIRLILISLLLAGTFSTGAAELPGKIEKFTWNSADCHDFEIDGENLFSCRLLSLFYINRSYHSAWFYQDSLNFNAFELLRYIRQVDQQGLQPEDYHLHLIELYFGKVLTCPGVDTTDMMKLEVLLTDAFLLLGSHLYYGKVDPEKEGSDWNMNRKDPELRLDLKLEEALAENEIVRMLNMLAPGYRSYWMMKEELAFFLKLNDQIWPVIIYKQAIKPGDSSQLIPVIRERLMKLRYQLTDSVSTVLDEELVIRLKDFQEDWGLNPDGVIGKATLDGLNSLPYKLISQLKVNMERYRWLPLKDTGKYIIVNIANYKLDLISGIDTLVSMRVVVGKETRSTPVFNEQLSYIVFSPSWTVPPTILQDDVIPQLLKGPGYLEKRNMKLLRNDGSELAYNEIDWSVISKDNFPYIVRQEPGPGNALGQVKFMFPNNYNVYIHDTPSKGSFAREKRDVSSGCVRVENPFDLAVLLLSDSPEWSPPKIRMAMQQDKEQIVRLKIPVDVMLVYLTAWTDGRDRIQFRKDVYQKDEKVMAALNQKPEVTKAHPFLLK